MKKSVVLGIFLPLFFISLSCHATEYFTEQFFGAFDMDGLSITFTPVSATTNYTAKAFSITELPSDPSGHADVDFAGTNDDDVYKRIDVNSSDPVILYGVSYGEFHVGSNGYITFDAGDTDYSGGLTTHFNQPRISGLFADLHPGEAGGIKRKEFADRVVITYENVPNLGAENSNTFQIEMFFDGRIRLSWLGIDSNGGIVGLSAGGGEPDDFGFGSDLSSFEWDTDDDGMPNDWELLYFGGNTNGLPGIDFDLDGHTNLEEYIADTNPTNSSSVFQATQTNLVGGAGYIIGWTAAEGREYTVRTGSNLVSDDFSTVLQSDIPYPVNAYTTTVDQAQRFFKVDVQLAE